MATGSVLTKEKSRKGTPDIFIPTEEGYIMCEVTTQENRLEKRLKHDIDHCMSQKGIPLEKILKIVLICNSKIRSELYQTIRQYKNVVTPMIRMDIIDVDDLATRIYKNYHSIIRELGITIDTNQIFEPAEFVHQYDRSRFAISLTNRFYNRDAELALALQGLEDHVKIEVKNFTHGELQQILSSPEFDISEPFIDRIYGISKGNPRLAIMCVRAGIEQGATALQNASSIYEKYFSGMLENIGGLLQNQELLKVAGIVSLMRTINLNDADQIDEIHECFGLSSTSLK